MSNVYIKEPPTSGKVILTTTVGEIELELWAKECPKACRNFIQLCMEGYYNNTVFHRLVKNFIIQGGDPTGLGTGGESIYGGPFKTEIHSRLSFSRRGLLGMACLEKDQNASQFFFTLGPADELTGKHTLFGRAAGETLFNLLRLGEVEISENNRPKRLHKILKTEVIINPYDDIELRQNVKSHESKSEDSTSRIPAVKNLTLLSFGDDEEAEEEEFQITKGKSAHDHSTSNKLSSELVDLQADHDVTQKHQGVTTSEDYQQLISNERKRKKESKVSEEEIKHLKEEADELKKAIMKSKNEEKERALKAQEKVEGLERKKQIEAEEEEQFDQWQKTSESAKDDLENFNKYLVSSKVKSRRQRKLDQAKREDATMNLLENFRNKLQSSLVETQESAKDNEDDDEFNLDDDLKWLKSKLTSEESDPSLSKAFDASKQNNPDRYDLHDPRNPLNLRKRESDSKSKT